MTTLSRSTILFGASMSAEGFLGCFFNGKIENPRI
jgi:hypothetical protein